MNKKILKQNPSEALEYNNLERKFKKKVNNVNSFTNSIITVIEMITHFKHKNHKSKENYKKYETLTSILESVDTVFIIGATTTFLVTGVSLIVLLIFPGNASVLSLGNKVIQRTIISKYNEYKKNLKKTKKAIKTFDELYR